MPSRFTVTEKWKDPWFRGLKPSAKLLFLYLCDQCDVAGFWEIDWQHAAFATKLNTRCLQGACEGLNGKIESDGKYIRVVNFLKHQRNWPLNPENRVHGAILKILEQHKNFKNQTPIKPLTRSYGNGKGKSNGKGKGKRFIPPTLLEVQTYIRENNYDVNPAEFIKYYASSDPPWHDQNGKPVRSWKQKLIAVWAKKPKAKKCIHCGKLGVYIKKDDTEHPYWLCEDHKPRQKPLPKNTPVPQMKKVPDGVNINDARNKNLDVLGIK